MSGGAPGVDQALVVEAGQFGPPALQPHDGVPHRGRRDLGLSDAAALQAEQGNAACGKPASQTSFTSQKSSFHWRFYPTTLQTINVDVCNRLTMINKSKKIDWYFQRPLPAALNLDILVSGP